MKTSFNTNVIALSLPKRMDLEDQFCVSQMEVEYLVGAKSII
jgi:hypothetical protein